MQPSDLRVALFSGNYNYVRDGANQALNLLVEHLLGEGVAVRVYSPTTDTPAFVPQGDLVNVPAFPFPGRGEYKVGRGLPAEPRRDLKAFAPNLVHVSAPELLGHAAAKWARRHDIPVVASLHTRFETYFRYYNIGFFEPLVLRIATRFYDRADLVLTPSSSMGEVLREWGVRSPIKTWSRGVNHRRFSPERRDLAWRRSLGIGDEEVAVGFVGRLVLEKGIDVFAEVVKVLRARGVRHRVLVIGEGPAREQFAEQVPEAVFTGFQAGDDLGRAIASLDIFFNPSVTETFGNVTLEAMAAGVPTVAARATGTVDLVEDGVTGFLVEPRDFDGYAAAIEMLASDDARRLAAGRASHAVAEDYRWESANGSVLDAYLALMKERRHHHHSS